MYRPRRPIASICSGCAKRLGLWQPATARQCRARSTMGQHRKPDTGLENPKLFTYAAMLQRKRLGEKKSILVLGDSGRRKKNRGLDGLDDDYVVHSRFSPEASRTTEANIQSILEDMRKHSKTPGQEEINQAIEEQRRIMLREDTLADRNTLDRLASELDAQFTSKQIQSYRTILKGKRLEEELATKSNQKREAWQEEWKPSHVAVEQSNQELSSGKRRIIEDIIHNLWGLQDIDVTTSEGHLVVYMSPQSVSFLDLEDQTRGRLKPNAKTSAGSDITSLRGIAQKFGVRVVRGEMIGRKIKLVILGPKRACEEAAIAAQKILEKTFTIFLKDDLTLMKQSPHISPLLQGGRGNHLISKISSRYGCSFSPSKVSIQGKSRESVSNAVRALWRVMFPLGRVSRHFIPEKELSREDLDYLTSNSEERESQTTARGKPSVHRVPLASATTSRRLHLSKVRPDLTSSISNEIVEELAQTNPSPLEIGAEAHRAEAKQSKWHSEASINQEIVFGHLSRSQDPKAEAVNEKRPTETKIQPVVPGISQLLHHELPTSKPTLTEFIQIEMIAKMPLDIKENGAAYWLLKMEKLPRLRFRFKIDQNTQQAQLQSVQSVKSGAVCAHVTGSPVDIEFIKSTIHDLKDLSDEKVVNFAAFIETRLAGHGAVEMPLSFFSELPEMYMPSADEILSLRPDKYEKQIKLIGGGPVNGRWVTDVEYIPVSMELVQELSLPYREDIELVIRNEAGGASKEPRELFMLRSQGGSKDVSTALLKASIDVTEQLNSNLARGKSSVNASWKEEWERKSSLAEASEHDAFESGDGYSERQHYSSLGGQESEEAQTTSQDGITNGREDAVSGEQAEIDEGAEGQEDELDDEELFLDDPEFEDGDIEISPDYEPAKARD